jgi:hypothetical protein
MWGVAGSAVNPSLRGAKPRSNPVRKVPVQTPRAAGMDCFALLAMTRGSPAMTGGFPHCGGRSEPVIARSAAPKQSSPESPRSDPHGCGSGLLRFARNDGARVSRMWGMAGSAVNLSLEGAQPRSNPVRKVPVQTPRAGGVDCFALLAMTGLGSPECEGWRGAQ